MGSIEQFEERILTKFPTSVVRSGSTVLIDLRALHEVLRTAQSSGFGVLGLDGFKMSGEFLVPMMDCIVDLSSAVSAGVPISQQFDAVKSFISECQDKPDLVEIVLFDPEGST